MVCSKGIRNALTRAQPESRSDLMSLNHAYRRPFIQDGTVGQLVRRMRNPSVLNQDRGPGFPEDDLTTIDAVEDVLDDTYGLLLFKSSLLRSSTGSLDGVIWYPNSIEGA